MLPVPALRRAFPIAATLLLACAADPVAPSPEAAKAPSAPILAPPPTVTASLRPDEVFPYDPVRCTALAVSASGEPLAVRIAWERDGEGVEHPPLLPRYVVGPGEHWRCVATAASADGVSHTATAEFETEAAPGDNVLILIADDLGIDNVGAYGHVDDPPSTPRLDTLAASGVRFNNAFGYSSCSPTRAAMMTGRYGRRTGAIALVGPTSRYELPLSEVTLAEVAASSPVHSYTSSAIGKWHLGWNVSGPAHPTLQGWDWFAGSRGNLNVDGLGYTAWTKWVDGQAQHSTTYATTDTTDDAIARIDAMAEPWVAWVAYNAPHYPFEAPPEALYSGPALAPDAPVTEVYDAMVEAMDTEIGRLLDQMDPGVLARTTVFVVGDNGTPKGPTTSPMRADRAKLTPYAGGTQVPLIVAGPRVAAPGVADALVHVVDLFPTIAAIAGTPLDERAAELDGRSLLRILADPTARGRDWLYGEMYEADGQSIETIGTVQDHRYKLISRDGHDELYDLTRNPYHEGPDLLMGPLDREASMAYDQLMDQLQEHLTALGPLDLAP